jgi:uncharacterized membrane protein
MSAWIKIGLLLLLAFFSALMIRITIPYFSLDDNTAFLRIKQWVIENQIWKTSFYVHVFTSSFCLIAGFTQFSKNILQRFPMIHRSFGILYVVVILVFSGPSGFVMSLYANGGILSRMAFTMLSVLWMYFTFKAFFYAKAGNFAEHRKFMIRSFALTLSALTLRAWKFGIVWVLRPQPMDVYLLVAWLGWVPNLLFAEFYLRKGFEQLKVRFQR